jgi:hypothetical protein
LESALVIGTMQSKRPDRRMARYLLALPIIDG